MYNGYHRARKRMSSRAGKEILDKLQNLVNFFIGVPFPLFPFPTCFPHNQNEWQSKLDLGDSATEQKTISDSEFYKRKKLRGFLHCVWHSLWRGNKYTPHMRKGNGQV
ncbi:hypothetical protein L6164_010468 [Bauhinia variegata]|uniref:Uncharacterized protein n=1 Tax=Bauhinia variegata TaxID=167791 RepID=A0ACB9PN35_BAUVA|nr:hypothetical protein L6164_010468 [Bauhinia variegata]